MTVKAGDKCGGDLTNENVFRWTRVGLSGVRWQAGGRGQLITAKAHTCHFSNPDWNLPDERKTMSFIAN